AFHAVITLPPVEEKELSHHVEAKVKKMLPRPIEEMQVVHQKVPPRTPEEKDITLLVTAAPRRLVAFYTAIFQKAGLELDELETEAFAIERSLVGKDTATVMVVDIGAERTNFFIIDSGLPITHRSIQVGALAFDAIIEKRLGIPKDLIAQARIDASRLDGAGVPIEPFLSAIEPMVKEIQYNFDIFLHQSRNEGKRPEKIILTGGLSLFPPIQEYLKQQFQMKVFVGDPWARVVYQDGLRRVLDPIAPRMAVCIGLALRTIVK
ncbi:MAG: pilus assembly protein PilM, partial [Patescibacteria group bacterium]